MCELAKCPMTDEREYKCEGCVHYTRETDCSICEYYNIDEGTCTAFECNGIDCPKLPCEDYWIFTFGCGQRYVGKYVKIKGTFNTARQKMINKYGLNWGFQYSEEKWEEMKADPNRQYTMETELEVIE